MSILDYPDGSNDGSPIVLVDNSTQLEVLAGTATQSGAISQSGGSFGLEKIGAGNLILTANNSFTGDTTISAGILQIGNGGASGSITGNIIDNSVLAFSNLDSFVLGAISGTGSVVILSGYTAFTANNTYTGGTTIDSGATLEIGGTFGALTGNIFNQGIFAPTVKFDGVISGSGIVHIRPAISPIVLSGINTYTGATQFDTNAYLVVTGSIANSTISLPAYTQLGGTGTVGATTVGSSSVVTPGVATGAIGTLSIAGDLTIAGGSYAADLVPGSADKLQVSGATTIDPNSVLSITLAASVTYSPGVYTLLNSVGNLSGQFSYVNYSYYGNFSSGIVPFISYDAHNVFLTLSQEKTWLGSPATNLFTSTANWVAGATPGSGETAVFGSSSITTIAINSPITIGGMRFAGGFPRYTFNVTGAGGLTINNRGINDPNFSAPIFNVANGSFLTFTGFATSTGAVINVAQGGVLFYSGAADPGTSRIDGPNGVLDIGGISRTTFGISTLGTIGTIDLGGKTLLIIGGVTVSANIVDNSLSNGSHPSAVRITGGGVRFTGTSTYTGGTIIDSNGDLRLGNNGTTGSIVGNIADDGLLSFERSDTITYGGVVSGAGRVDQFGSGTTILGATNIYTGVTTVRGGTLIVDGAIASSAVTVAGGAVLGGTGTVGTTTIQSGGTLAPGDTIGTLHVGGNLTLAAGAAIAEGISSSAADEVIVSGHASIAGTLTVNFAAGSSSHPVFTILHADGGVSGTFANIVVSGLPAGLAANVSYDANNVYLTADNAPAVTTSNVTNVHFQTLALSTLFTASDADGDAITKYQLWDSTNDPNSGHFVVNGVAQAARTVIEITAAQLAQTSFVTGSVGDSLQIRAYDGALWSAADNAQWAPFTVTVPANNPPVVTTSNVNTTAGQSLTASALFTASDADGDTITRYQLWDGNTDPNSGYFVVGGVAQAARTVIDISAAQLSQVNFVAGTAGDSLQIRAYDGTDWSADANAKWSPFTVSVPADNPPVVATSNINAQRGQTLAASSLFTVSDADGDTITRYQLWDGSTDPASGHFVVGGVVQAARTLIDISAAQLAQVSFVTGSAAPDTLQIRAYDGIAWSAADNAQWSPFTVTVPINHAPVVTTSDVNTQRNQTLAASSLFSVSDADNDTITRYELWDATTDPASGHFVVGGVVQAARTVIDISAAQLAQVSFVTGKAGDALQIRAFDGTDWSAADNARWSPFNVTVPPNNAPVVTTSDVAAQHDQTLALSSLFTVSDADNDTITKYQLWDSTTAPDSGHFVVGGVAQASRTVIEITPSQLAQTSFVAGGVGASLQIRAFDGIDWSAADNARWSPFNVTVPPNNAPVVTTADVTTTAGQSLTASSLFTASDADGDAITEYQFWDSTADPASGHFVVSGVAQAARTVIDLPASQLGQISFLTGSVGDMLQVRAFDGRSWSAADNAQWAPFHIVS